MTWADYTPIPGAEWASTNRQGSVKQIRVAIVTADFPDQPFVMTLPRHSDLYGNPQIDPVTRDVIPNFYADFYNKPLPVNRGHTIHEYWMEQSRGRIGVTVAAFGPYRMPLKVFQYGGLTELDLPDGHSQSSGLSRQLDSLWRADRGDTITRGFDVVLRLFAGYDETATWQEFGEMKFQTRDDIPPEWGNPDTSRPRWVRTRYVEWTSWNAGQWLWSNSAIVQGEAINTIRHEIAHFAFRIGDNYNNPYARPLRRAPAGPWDLMDRGSFNGPGGPHRRWVSPPVEGGSMSAGLMLRQRLRFGFIDSAAVPMFSREGLARSGMAVANITARAVEPLPGSFPGIVVRLDGVPPHDRTPVDDPASNPLSSGTPDFNFYTMEVVQRIGYDSFTPDNGVLLAKNKTNSSPAGGPNGYNTFTWVIDAQPEDINKVDFRRPNGDEVMRSLADYRQLNDALFHAGLNSGSQYEWQDIPNRLHFYIVDIQRDAHGIISYTVAVRSLDGSGPQTRGVLLQPPDQPWLDGIAADAADAAGAAGAAGTAGTAGTAGAVNLSAVGPPFAVAQREGRLSFLLTNTGVAAELPPGAQPKSASPHFDSDVFRLSVSVEGSGWDVHLQNALATAKVGESIAVPVFLRQLDRASTSALVTLTATSESDPSRSAHVTYTLRR
jgi:M6 family metalloprotease-like protein